MNVAAFELMASHEAQHWWFVGRRAVIDGLLDRIDLPPGATVLEAGCGTGGNLSSLQRRGIVSAFEPSPAGAGIARSRHPDMAVESGELPHMLPFPEGTFDLVAALDILEHIQDDAGALEALVRLSRPGGHVLITVPTHPFIWGSHDRRLSHVRRYAVGQLLELCRRQDADVIYEGAFNTVLAPVAFAARLAEKFLGFDIGNQERLPAWPINQALSRLFALERGLVRRTRLPVGLSHAVILRRSNS